MEPGELFRTSDRFNRADRPCAKRVSVSRSRIAYLHVNADYRRIHIGGARPRLALVSIAVVLEWPSTRGLSVGNIAGQLGCSPSAVTLGLR